MKFLSRFAPTSRVLALAGACVLLASCGSKVKGDYTGDGIDYKFDGSNVTETVAGVATQPMPYSVDGKTVTVKTPIGEDKLTINDDGTLSGPMGVKLAKK